IRPRQRARFSLSMLVPRPARSSLLPYTPLFRSADLVPGFGALGKQRATLRQLLAHTAGLPFGLVPPPLGLDKVGNLAVKAAAIRDRKSTRLNSSHVEVSYAVFCLQKKRHCGQET